MKFQNDFTDGIVSFSKDEEVMPIEFSFNESFLSGIRVLVKLVNSDTTIDVDLGLVVDSQDVISILKKTKEKQEEHMKNMVLGNKYGI